MACYTFITVMLSFLILHVLLYSKNVLCETILIINLVGNRVLSFLGNGILRFSVFNYCGLVEFSETSE